MSTGRYLWTRTIGSTIVGQAIDSTIFYPLAFYDVWPAGKIVSIVAFNCVFKVVVEAAFTPVTYLIVNNLKRAEREDYFDRHTDFTPFSLRD